MIITLGQQPERPPFEDKGLPFGAPVEGKGGACSSAPVEGDESGVHPSQQPHQEAQFCKGEFR